MEPMTLGSPAQSPKNNPMNFTPNSAYLPGYLLGEHQNNSSQRHGSLSPTKNRAALFKSPEDRTFLPQNQSFTPQNQSFTPQNQSYVQGLYQSEIQNSPVTTKQKVTEKSGPPVQGLFDTLEARYKYDPKDQLNSSKNTTTFDTFQSNTLIGEEKLTSTPKRYTRQNTPQEFTSPGNWVTILGFPPSTTSVILAHFAQCGTILDKKFPSQGNWVHLKYSNQYEVNKALAFNGKVLGGSIMVGVLPYRPQENKENETSFNGSFNMASPRPVRSLAQPYLSPQKNPSEITSPIPQKSTGMVTKAMEYVFGW